MSIKNIVKEDGSAHCIITGDNIVTYVDIQNLDMHHYTVSISYGDTLGAILQLPITPKVVIKLLRIYGRTYGDFY